MSQQRTSENPEAGTSLSEKYDSLPGIIFSLMMVIIAVGGGVWIYIASIGGGQP